MIGRRLPVLLLLAQPACETFFPLVHDEPSDVFAVTGTLTRRFVHNDANGLPLAEPVPYGQLELTATAVLADGTEVDVTFDTATGDFSFPRAANDQPYRLVLGYPNEGRFVEYHATAPTLQLGDNRFGRIDQVVPTTPPTIQGVVSSTDPFTAGDTLHLASTGVWTPIADPDSFDPTLGSYSATWPSALLSASAHDRLWLYVLDNTGPQFLISRLASQEVSLDPTFTRVDVMLDPAGPVHCFHLTTARADELARLVSVYQGTQFAFTNSGWQIGGYPAPQLDSQVGLFAGQNTDAQEDLDVSFTMPFPGLEPHLIVVAALVRTLSTGIDIAVFATTVVPLEPECPATKPTHLVPAGVAPIPNRIALGLVVLANDNQPLVLGDTPVELSWDVDVPGADLFIVRLIDVTAEPATIRNTYFTTEPHALIDPTKIEPDRTYLFDVEAHIGFPDARDGDFDRRVYPATFGGGKSASFVTSN